MFCGSRLKEQRIAKGLSQEALGKELGLSKAAISLYENGKRSPKFETILDIMFLFGVSADYLLGSDVIVEVENAKNPKYRTLTQNEMDFITELRKESLIYEILFQQPKRGVEYIKKLIR